MATTPAQPPVSTSPPPPPVVSPPLGSSLPTNNATSPPPSQSPPPATPPPVTPPLTPSPPPPNDAPPPPVILHLLLQLHRRHQKPLLRHHCLLPSTSFICSSSTPFSFPTNLSTLSSTVFRASLSVSPPSPPPERPIQSSTSSFFSVRSSHSVSSTTTTRGYYSTAIRYSTTNILPPPVQDSPSEILVPPGSNNTPQNNLPPSAPDTSNSTHTSGIGTGAVVGISVAAALIVFSLIGLIVWCVRRREKRLSAVSGGYVTPSPMSSSSSRPGNSRPLFSYEELVKATNGFSQENLLGEGGFGCVYKGVLPDGRVVAVKQLKIGGGQGDREFKAEVETLSRIHHRHLVSIVGHCISDDRRLLIYDYVSNNDLYFHLHASKEVLDWATRVRIAAGAARGLAYLHEDCHPRIIHRDIKSSNILLENNFDARVSDFGLARLALDCNTHITTRVMGTFGYLAPEYASSGKLTEKSDVYSFGVVLLELITGRKPVDSSQPLGEESLVEWARPLISHAVETEEFDSLEDPKLGGNYQRSLRRHSAAKRPRMGQVVRALESLSAEDLTNGMRLGESEVFDSAQQSAEIRLFRRMAFGSQNYSTDFFTHSSHDSRDQNIPQKLAHKMRKFVIRRKKRRDMKTFLPTKEEEHLSGDESRVSCMEGIEEMLQELSMEGEFVFGSFWRQGDSTNDLDSRNSQYNDHSLSCSSHKM
ncbi:hypothetical protein Bca52824_083414 [Brassica carinata]|uniref:non-specific serine/threonine protein kinase n=1 Tax=Brassica carinata TaxID=52824 RepID=A0A8X7PMC0_BRACI|nr:hypothetical protein Bca52824_083414 [Brassica carinata]